MQEELVLLIPKEEVSPDLCHVHPPAGVILEDGDHPLLYHRSLQDCLQLFKDCPHVSS